MLPASIAWSTSNVDDVRLDDHVPEDVAGSNTTNMRSLAPSELVHYIDIARVQKARHLVRPDTQKKFILT